MSTDKDTIESYSQYAAQWATRMRAGENIAHEFLEKPAMYERLPDLNGKRVLAIGCGTGEECNYFKEKGAAKVVGIDISAGLIKVAQEQFADIEFKVMDMENMQLNEKFDFVYSSLVMHYVESWQKTLQSVAAVMQSGATYLLSTHHPVTWGALRTRSDAERTSLLGYKKYRQTQNCEVVGDYLNTRKIDDIWFDDFKVSYYHRPLESIMQDIISSDFEIIDFAEPKAILEAQQKDAVFYEIHNKIPLFMIFKLRKK